jgi:hypothetical protein
MPWGQHLGLLYEQPADLLDLLVPYCAAGLEDHEYCLMVTTEALPWQTFLHRMSQRIPDLMVHVQQGDIAIVSATTWYLTEGTFDQRALLQKIADTLAHALRQGYAGVRLSGDATWLDHHTWSEFLAYEAELHTVLRMIPMLLLCTYPVGQLAEPAIRDVASRHDNILVRRHGMWVMLGESNPLS